MLRRQRGATFLGMMIIIAILGFALYAAIRLMPIFLEYMAVVRALEQTSKEFSNNVTSQQDLRTSLERRWAVEDINRINWKDIEIKRTGNGFTMRAAYRPETPFVGNVSLIVDFDKSVDVK